jgi:hypothetical protein
MIAVFAAIVFALAFLLQLFGTDTGKVSLLFLGLFLLALHFVWSPGVPWRRQP